MKHIICITKPPSLLLRQVSQRYVEVQHAPVTTHILGSKFFYICDFQFATDGL